MSANDGTLARLIEVLGSRNAVLRREATAALEHIPLEDAKLRAALLANLSNTLWEARIATADALRAVVKASLARLLFDPDEAKKAAEEDAIAVSACSSSSFSNLENFNICELICKYRPLLSCAESAFGEFTSAKAMSKLEQRKLVDLHLEIYQTGVTSNGFIGDDDLNSDRDFLAGTSGIKQEPKNVFTADEDDSIAPVASISAASDALATSIRDLARTLCAHILDADWHRRHGASLALTRLIGILPARYLLPLTEIISLRILQLLALDRFTDFVSGSSAVAPVRESAAQALSLLMLNVIVETSSKNIQGFENRTNIFAQLVKIIVRHLHAFLNIKDPEHWHIRFTALLVLRYYFAACDASTKEFDALFRRCVDAVMDTDDEVISRAVAALAAFIGNTHVNIAIKRPLIQHCMDVIWRVILDEDQLFELLDDVNSLLIDLLSIVDAWLHADTTALFDGARFYAIARLIDARSVARSTRALCCVGVALRNARAFGANASSIYEHVFLIIKLSYRCLLFASCDIDAHEMQRLFNAIFDVQQALIDTLRARRFADAVPLATVTRWLACLFGSHRQLSIDVFRHNVDGIASTSDSPDDMLCGEEMCTLTEETQNELLTARKIVAGRFLGAIFYAIYSAGVATQNRNEQEDFMESITQEEEDAVQRCFASCLRGTSLYGRLGASMVVLGFADAYRNDLNKDAQPTKPAILIDALEAEIFNGSARLPYVEVCAAVGALTAEINEFQRYCAQRGVPSAELLAAGDAANMEQVAEVAYEALKKRLKRKADLESLQVRYDVVLDSIQSARIAHRINTFRVDVLFVAALLKLGHAPHTFTPLIRPLLEAAAQECNQQITDAVFGDAFAAVIELAMQRGAVSTLAKLLRSLAAALCHCDNYAPKLGQIQESLQIYSLSKQFIEPTARGVHPKTRNVHVALKLACTRFGIANFVDVCSRHVGNLVDLDVPDVQTFLVNLEFIVFLHNQFADDFDCSHLDVFKPLYEPNHSMTMWWDSTNGHVNIFTVECAGNEVTTNKEQANGQRAINTTTSSLVFAHYLAHNDSAVRHRVARLISVLAARQLAVALNLVYSTALEHVVDDVCADTARCGAVELLAALATREHAVLGAVALLAPLALRLIGDSVETIRTTAANTFGKFVAILALENTSKHLLGNKLEARVRAALDANSDFAQVLSSPQNLPLLRRDQIAGLRDDVKLRGYQLEGITWMLHLTRFGLNGILADDMGLGKTLQVLCLFDVYRSRNVTQQEPRANQELAFTSIDPATLPAVASMIVCPKTLVTHWCREWREYFPQARRSFAAALSTSHNAMRKYLCDNWDADLVLVVSYPELRVLASCLSEFRWNFVVLDEGHCIRNQSNQLYRAVTSIVSRHRLILSGTPVQNSPADLWALFTYLMPGYLSSKTDFNATYLKKIMASRSSKATEQQVEESEIALKALHHRVLPFILRRLKTDVLAELPPKIVQDYTCELTSIQRRFYTLIVNHSMMGSSKAAEAKGIDQKNGGMGKTLFSPLQTMILLRKLVDHPALVADVVLPLLSADQVSAIRHEIDDMSYELSGKMIALKDLLGVCQIGISASAADGDETGVNDLDAASALVVERIVTPRQRALVFCQWRVSAALVARCVERGDFGVGISYLMLDGSVPPANRQNIVDRFNRDTSVDLLILTTQIGGVGLTLTGANVVIMVDHDWNPVVDLQAIDRAHRLGQTRTVNVYRLITQATVEEKVMNLQKFKFDTANVLIGANNRSLSSMAASDLRELFSLELDQTEKGGNSAGVGAAKRRRFANDASQMDSPSDDTIYSLGSLWNYTEREYDDSHSLETFVKQIQSVEP